MEFTLLPEALAFLPNRLERVMEKIGMVKKEKKKSDLNIVFHGFID